MPHERATYSQEQHLSDVEFSFFFFTKTRCSAKAREAQLVYPLAEEERRDG